MCEQYHSFLSWVQRTATHMRQDNFMCILRLAMDLWNADKLEAMKVIVFVLQLELTTACRCCEIVQRTS